MVRLIGFNESTTRSISVSLANGSSNRSWATVRPAASVTVEAVKIGKHRLIHS